MAKKGILELIGKTKGKVDAITILSEKSGQNNVIPAVDIGITVTLPNKSLGMISQTIRAFLYENTGKGTGDLAGVQPVSDLPNLTDAAQRLGALNWEYEQTGCKLTVYSGATGHGDIKLKDCTVRKLKIDPKEGGSVDLTFHVYTTDVDEDTLGALAVLKSLERDIELEGPSLAQQKRLDEAQDGKDTTKPPTNKRQTPAQALAATLGQTSDVE